MDTAPLRKLVDAMAEAAQAGAHHEVAREHQPLIDAIDARDEATAAQAIEEHILSTVGAVVTRLGGTTDALLTPR